MNSSPKIGITHLGYTDVFTNLNYYYFSLEHKRGNTEELCRSLFSINGDSKRKKKSMRVNVLSTTHALFSQFFSSHMIALLKGQVEF